MSGRATEGRSDAQSEGDTGIYIFTGALHRVRRGREMAFVETAPSPAAPREPVRQPARIALMLALAHKIQAAIDAGTIRDQAEAARRLGLTRARLTQLMGLTLLPPPVQEEIIFWEAVDGVEPMSERGLRISRSVSPVS